MEEVPGIPGSVPLLAEYPPKALIQTLPPEEWQVCLDTWIFCVEFRLRLLPEHFHHFTCAQSASGLPFLSTYLESLSQDSDGRHSSSERPLREKKLFRHCLLLLRRLLLESDLLIQVKPLKLLDLLGNASLVFSEICAWRETLQRVYENDRGPVTAAVEAAKANTIVQVTTTNVLTETVLKHIKQLNALMKAFPVAGSVLMSGSDYLEALMTSYHKTRWGDLASPRSMALTENAYLCFHSLMLSVPPKTSTLIDHLYSLKSEAENTSADLPSHGTLLSSLICSTTFLRRLDGFIAATGEGRGEQLLSYLRIYHEQTRHIHGIRAVRKKNKGKGKMQVDDDHQLHMHQATQVSQIQELFPSLSQAYIMQLLDFFMDDIEVVTAALLEPDRLPEHLRDQSTGGDTDLEPVVDSNARDRAPRSATQPRFEKRNIFDGDDFDHLRISSSNIHRGKKEMASVPKSKDEHARSKAAILAALAVFDSDDDERDDTYDVADVGGSVDATVDTDERPRARQPVPTDPNEGLLYGAWKSNPELFARDSKTRLAQPRQQLKRDTGLGDEQLEGWAVMLNRDPAQQQRLEKWHSAAAVFRGNQKGLGPGKWTASRSATGTDDEDGDLDAAIDDSSRGTAAGRRLGAIGSRDVGQRGGRGGSVAGPSGDAATQAARRRKEQGRGRGGASHNRREGRAKKMGRGMGGPLA